jgi:hypothetical protein
MDGIGVKCSDGTEIHLRDNYCDYWSNVCPQGFTTVTTRHETSGWNCLVGITVYCGSSASNNLMGSNSGTEYGFTCPAGQLLTGIRSKLDWLPGSTFFLNVKNVRYLCSAMPSTTSLTTSRPSSGEYRSFSKCFPARATRSTRSFARRTLCARASIGHQMTEDHSDPPTVKNLVEGLQMIGIVVVF